MGVEIAIGIAVGAVIGGAAAGIQSGGDFDAIWKGALVGAVGGAVGGWAAPALAPALGVTSAAGVGALAGGIGGVTTGLLGTAISGGNSSDYLRSSVFGGLGGAAVGGIAGGLGEAFGGTTVNGEIAAPVSGAEGVSGALPADASGIPLTSQGGYAFDDAAQAATGMSNVGGGSELINTSVTGATAQPTASYTAPQISADIAMDPTLATTTQTSVPSLGDTVTNAAANAQSLDSGVMNPNVMTQGVEAPQGSFGTSFDTATPTATTTDYSSMTDAYGNKYSDLYGDNFQKAMEAGASGKSYDPNNYISNNAMSWGEKLNYGLENMFGKSGVDMVKNLGKGSMISQGLKGAGALLGQNEARQNQRQLMDLYNQQNAYMQQQQGQNAQAFQQNLTANTANQQAFRDQLAAAQGYNTQLQGTYEDPNAYLNSPEAQASRSLAMQKLLAQNAMAGRRSSGLAMQNQLMANQLGNLANYRQGLRQSIQYPNQAPSMQYQATAPATTAELLAAAQRKSPTTTLMTGLSDIFSPPANYYLMAN